MIVFYLTSYGISNADFPSSQSYPGCAYGSDGSVSCGGKYPGCSYGSNGSVSCGGKYPGCAYGSDGSVSCGGSPQ